MAVTVAEDVPRGVMPAKEAATGGRGMEAVEARAMRRRGMPVTMRRCEETSRRRRRPMGPGMGRRRRMRGEESSRSRMRSRMRRRRVILRMLASGDFA